jgi:hypothetical protein
LISAEAGSDIEGNGNGDLVEIDIPCDHIDEGKSWFLDWLYSDIYGTKRNNWDDVRDDEDFYRWRQYFIAASDTSWDPDTDGYGRDRDFPSGTFTTTYLNPPFLNPGNSFPRDQASRRRDLAEAFVGIPTERTSASIMMKDTIQRIQLRRQTYPDFRPDWKLKYSQDYVLEEQRKTMNFNSPTPRVMADYQGESIDVMANFYLVGTTTIVDNDSTVCDFDLGDSGDFWYANIKDTPSDGPALYVYWLANCLCNPSTQTWNYTTKVCDSNS